MAYSDEQPASPQDDGSWIPAIVIGLMLAAAVLFTLYLLVWDGGGNT